MSRYDEQRLERLDPAWIHWICDSLERRAPLDQICAQLSARGDADPRATLAALEAHPIFQWARSRHVDAQRALYFRTLHEQLWELRERSLPTLERPSAQTFFEDYYLTARPVVIRGWASEWPAIQRWDPERWVEDFAEVEVEVSASRDRNPRFDRDFNACVQTTLGSFAREVLDAEMGNDRYLIARNYAFERPELAALLTDIDERPYLDPAHRHGLALWFGPAGTHTPLHHDTCQIMFAQIRGVKRFSLIPPHAQSLFEDATAMYSDLDPTLDLSKHPQHPHQIDLTLRAGEALFIPVGWWHAVRSESVSISVAMTHFVRPNTFAWYRPNSRSFKLPNA